MNEDGIPLWEQRSDETPTQFARFRTFLLLGSERSVLGAYRRHRSDAGRPLAARGVAVPQSWREDARRFEWHVRAAAWDKEQSRLEEEGRNAKWKERRGEVQNRAYHLHEELVKKAEAMLRFPLSRTTVTETGTIIEPARWTFDTLAKVAQVADGLGRLACDMETVRIAHQIDGLDEGELNEQAALALVALLREGKLSPEVVAQIERVVQIAKPDAERERALEGEDS